MSCTIDEEGVWHRGETPNDALPEDCLVARMLGADTVRPELLQEATEFLEECAEDFKSLATAGQKALPLDLWQVLAPILDDCILEALRDLDDPDAAPDPYHPERRQEVSDVIDALRDWLLPLGPRGGSMRAAIVGTPPEFISFHLRQVLTEQARIARGEA